MKNRVNAKMEIKEYNSEMKKKKNVLMLIGNVDTVYYGMLIVLVFSAFLDFWKTFLLEKKKIDRKTNLVAWLHEGHSAAEARGLAPGLRAPSPSLRLLPPNQISSPVETKNQPGA